MNDRRPDERAWLEGLLSEQRDEHYRDEELDYLRATLARVTAERDALQAKVDAAIKWVNSTVGEVNYFGVLLAILNAPVYK